MMKRLRSDKKSMISAIVMVVTLFTLTTDTNVSAATTSSSNQSSVKKADRHQVKRNKNKQSGKLMINQRVLQQKAKRSQSKQGNSNKAASEIPDLFDPKYSKGIEAERAHQNAGNRTMKQHVFVAKKLQTDRDDKGITKSKRHLFTGKKAVASTTASETTTTDTENFDVLHWLFVGLIMVVFAGIGVLVGIKGQKLIFRRRQHG